MEGSKLVVENNRGTVRCRKCSYEGYFKYVDDYALHVSMPTLECPKCGSTVKIVSGKDCLIKSVKMLI